MTASRIDINGRWLSKPLTGTGRYATQVTRALIASGHEVVLWVPRDASVPRWARSARVRRARTTGQLFEQITLPWSVRGRTLLSMGGPAPALKRRQVVVLHDATPFRLPQTYSRAFAAWYRWLYRSVSRRGARLVTVSEFSARELSDVLKRSEDDFSIAAPAATLAPQGRDLDPSTRARLPATFFLTVGTLAAHKNLVPVISALTRAGLSVVTVGTTGSSQVFADVGLPDNPAVVHLGRVSDEELLTLYRTAAALVFPSFYEGFGLPVLEAQAAECAVIASNAGPLPDVLGESALFGDPTDPESFVAAARTLLTSDRVRSDLVRSGVENAARFDWSRTAAILSAAVASADLD